MAEAAEQKVKEIEELILFCQGRNDHNTLKVELKVELNKAQKKKKVEILFNTKICYIALKGTILLQRELWRSLRPEHNQILSAVRLVAILFQMG